MVKRELFDYATIDRRELYVNNSNHGRHIHWPDHDLHLHIDRFANGLRHVSFHKNNGTEVKTPPLDVELAATNIELGEGFMLTGITCFSPNFGRTASIIEKYFSIEYESYSRLQYTFSPRVEQKRDFLVMGFLRQTPQYIANLHLRYGALSGQDSEMSLLTSVEFNSANREKISMEFATNGALEKMYYSIQSMVPELECLQHLVPDKDQQAQILEKLYNAGPYSRVDYKETIDNLLAIAESEKEINLVDMIKFTREDYVTNDKMEDL